MRTPYREMWGLTLTMNEKSYIIWLVDTNESERMKMTDIIIIAIIAVFVAIGVRSTIKHFKGESSCCGGGSSVKTKKKKLKSVIATKTMIVEGMTCEHCRNRVERCINDIDGAAARVNLKKKEVTVSLDREISEEELCNAVQKAGYEVVSIR